MTQTQTQTSDIETQTQTQQNNEPQCIPLLDFEDDYDILNQYPFTIRRRDNHYVPSEFLKNEYPAVNLNGIPYYKHILVAKQFIPNQNNLPFVDHISRIKTDYHLNNLRFITHSENMRNKSSYKGIEYEYVDSIPEEAFHITNYNQHTFNDSEYFYYENVFYEYNGIKYRILPINENKSGNLYVNFRNDSGKCVHIYYSKFKRLNNIRFD